MVGAKMFGYDCIGFVGRYLEEAGVFPKYPGMYPRHYLDRFFPVQKIGDIDDGCIVVWINGSHIAVIDTKVKIEGGVATVNLCMSTSGGPQTSKGATLTHIASSTFLDFGSYGKEVDGKTVTEDERKEIQKKYQASGSRGYRDGLFFNIAAGTPSFPNNGTVYVGKMKDLVTNWRKVN